MRVLWYALIAVLGCTGAYGQSEKSLGLTKSLSATQGDALELWRGEVETLADEPAEVKSLIGEKPPVVQEKRIETPQGTLVFSQLWDATVSDLCPTKVVLEKKQSDGSIKMVKILLEDTLPQILPEEISKTLGVDDQVKVSSDLKTLLIETDGGVQSFDLEW